MTRTNDEVFALAVGGTKVSEIGLSDKKPVRNEQRGIAELRMGGLPLPGPVPSRKPVNKSFLPGVRRLEQWTKQAGEWEYLSSAPRGRRRHNGRDENAEYGQ